MRLYDRSRVTTDWQCPRKRYLGYEYEGKGIATQSTHLELFLGTTLHDGLAAIAHFQRLGVEIDINTIAATANAQMVANLLPETGLKEETDFAYEQAALVEGLLRGFYKHVWPRMMKQYPEIVAIEQEMTYVHENLTFMAKPDLVVRDTEGSVWYIEYKSTSSKKEGWTNSWNTAVQLHSTIRAIESTIGEKVTGVVVQGLYKGFESYGKQSSPFCYAYKRNGNPPFTKDEVAYEYKAGFKRSPTWEMEGGVAKWVDGMPPTVLADQFPVTPPIFVKDNLIDAFFRQRATRENEIMVAMEVLEQPESDKGVVLDMVFPQRFDQCFPGYGKPCGYSRICHGHVENPLTAGYVFREPHHQFELDQWKEQEALDQSFKDLVTFEPEPD